MFVTRISRPLLVFSIAANLLMLAVPLHMMQVYDRVLVSASQETLLYITLLAAAALVVFGLCEIFRTIIAQKLANRFVTETADPLFARLVTNNADDGAGDRMIRHLNTIRSFLSSRALIGIYDLPFTPFFLVLLFMLHFHIGLITLAGAVLLLVIAFFNKTMTAKSNEHAMRANADASGFALTVLSRKEDIRAMGLLPALVTRWGAMMASSLNNQDRATSSNAVYTGISRSVRQVLQVLIMAWGAYLVLQADMSGGLIFAASLISGRALQPLEQIIGSWDGINRAKIASRELTEILADAEHDAQPVTQPEPSGRLKVEDVCFSAGEGEQARAIVDNISLSVLPGEMVAIVGPSGAGKSTLARMLSGAMQPTSGRVLLDDCAQQNWPTAQWGQYVGYVAQELTLFPGTIAENIARMEIEPDQDRLVNAAQLAGIHALINSFPDGYMTLIGGGGIPLSGGQKQRIALARALYSKPRILILDEPNAHLDTQGEAILLQTLQTLKEQGLAIVAITQRRDLLKIANRVMVMENGKAVTAKQQGRAQATPGVRISQRPQGAQAMRSLVAVQEDSSTTPDDKSTTLRTGKN